MAQAVSHLPVTAKARFRFQDSGTGPYFAACTLVFSYQYHSFLHTHLHLDVALTARTNGWNLGTNRKAWLFPKLGRIGWKSTFSFLTVGHAPMFLWFWCERGIWINRQKCWFWFNKPVSCLYGNHSLQMTGPTSLIGRNASKWNCLHNILSNFLPPRRHAAHSLPGSVDRSKNSAFGHKTRLCISFNLTVSSDCVDDII